MAMEIVKDKCYYLAEALGIPKGYLHLVLDVSETTLRKWSYNPANVSKEMSDLIFRRIAYLDLMGLRFEKVSDRVKDSLSYDEKIGKFCWPPSQTDYMWRITTRYDEPVYTQDFWKVGRALLYHVEYNQSQYMQNYSREMVEAVVNFRRWSKCPHGYMRIAKNANLEMPIGETRWDFDKQ